MGFFKIYFSSPRSILLTMTLFFVSSQAVLAIDTNPLLPIADGNYKEWTAVLPHYQRVDESVCNGNTDYTRAVYVGRRDSYKVDVSTVPNNAVITNISIIPCASKYYTGTATTTMNVFYRFNGTNSGDKGNYVLNGTIPVGLATTTFNNLSLIKNASSTLEVGAVLSSGNRGARLSRIAATVSYIALPKAPSNLTITASSSNSISVRWIDNSSNEDNFILERSVDGVVFAPIVMTSQDTTTYTDTSLNLGTYYYRVRAYNKAGYSSYSNAVSTTLVPKDITPPVLTNVNVQNITTTSADIVWTTDEPATSVVAYGPNASSTNVGTSNTLFVNNHRVSLSNLTPSTTYYYSVKSQDSAQNTAQSNLGSFTTLSLITATTSLPLPIAQTLPQVFPNTAGWPQSLGWVDASPVVADIDGNGDLEVVVGDRLGYLYVYNHDGTILAGWPKKLSGQIFASAAVADIDGDGKLEIFVGSGINHQPAFVNAFHYDGSVVNGWPKEISFLYNGNKIYGSLLAAPAIGDIDGDGKLDIALGVSDTLENQFYVWHSDGSLMRGFPKNFPNVYHHFQQTPALADLDNDGKLEIIIGDRTADNKGTKLFVWKYDGSDYPGWPKDLLWSSASPIVGDIDGDGKLEIVAASNFYSTGEPRRIYAWRSNGMLVPGWPQSVGVDEPTNQQAIALSPLALADLDNDGKLEIFVGAGDKLYGWDASGRLLSGWPVRTPLVPQILDGIGRYTIHNQVAVADIDGDGSQEIIAGGAYTGYSMYGALLAWHKDGTMVDGFPRKTNAILYSSPTITDLDRDGKLDIVIGSEKEGASFSGTTLSGGRIYVWEELAKFNPTQSSVLKFREDNYNSGFFKSSIQSSTTSYVAQQQLTASAFDAIQAVLDRIKAILENMLR